MRIGVFSDIHGNIFAFSEIFREIKKEKCDVHIFLGDICGYYYHQNEIIGMLKDIPQLKTLSGNHDILFLKSLEDKDILRNYTKKYGNSFNFLKDTITSVNLTFLRNLPKKYFLDDHKIAAFHGSPWDPIEEYIYPDSPMERFDTLSFKTIFLGHTHWSMDIKRNHSRIINPGSAGQPRDGSWPSYAVYDVEKDRLIIKQVPYSVKLMISEVKKRKDKNSYLIEVLKRICA